MSYHFKKKFFKTGHKMFFLFIYEKVDWSYLYLKSKTDYFLNCLHFKNFAYIYIYIFFFCCTHKSMNCMQKIQNASHILQNEALHLKYHKHISKAKTFTNIYIYIYIHTFQQLTHKIFTWKIYLIYSFWKLWLKHQKHTPNLQNQTLIPKLSIS